MKRLTDNLIKLLASGLFVLLTCVSAGFCDWPFERGDLQSSGVAQSNLADQLEVLWKYTAPESAFETTPVVAGGVAYLGDADGTVHAVSLADGSPVWTQKFEDTGFASAGLVSGGRFFIGDIYGLVRSLETSDGSEAWSFDTETEVYAGPTLYNDTLLVTTEGGRLYALAAADGAERWRFSIEAPLRCSPTIVGGHTLLAGCDEQLHAVDLSSGKEVGAVGIGGPTGSTAAASGGRAYFGTESGVFYAIDAKDPQAMAVAWEFRDPRRGQGIRSAAGIGKQVAVYGSNGKAIYGVSLATGEKAWSIPTRSRVESSPVIFQTPAGAERAAIATTRGRLMALDTATGEAVWDYDAGGGFTGSPAITDGKLLIANEDGTLYCFGGKELAADER